MDTVPPKKSSSENQYARLRAWLAFAHKTAERFPSFPAVCQQAIEAIRSAASKATAPLRSFFTRYELRIYIRGEWAFFLTVASLITFLISYHFFYTPPRDFPIRSVVSIEAGKTLGDIIHSFEEHGVIRSPLAMRLAVAFYGSDRTIIAGDYVFSEPLSVFAVTQRVLRGGYGLELIRVRIPEGAMTAEMAKIFKAHFENFDTEEFLRLAVEKEGYLFPDTYYFAPNSTAQEVVRVMENRFHEKLAVIKEKLDGAERELHEIITIASLLEREASDTKTRRTIAGILYNRLAVNMPLQIDAAFLYINGKNTYELSLKDLRENNSPYNTYKHKGLPPGPIDSPSMDSILASLNPIPSDYLFYLSDRAGNTYYAKTFEEHIANKRRHIY